MFYAELAKYIQSKVPALIYESNLFVNMMPAQTKDAALIRDNPGGIKVDGEMLTERAGSFQFVVRNTVAQESYQIAQAVSSALTLDGLELDGYLVKVLRPTHEPLLYQASEANLYESSVNFSVRYGIVQ